MHAHDDDVGVFVVGDGENAVGGTAGVDEVLDIATGNAGNEIVQLTLGGTDGIVGEIDALRHDDADHVQREETRVILVGQRERVG